MHSSTDVPRRAQLQQMTPAERAIRDVILLVEEMGADVRLTDAVVLLGAAQDSIADYVDHVARRRVVVTRDAQ